MKLFKGMKVFFLFIYLYIYIFWGWGERGSQHKIRLISGVISMNFMVFL